MSEAGLRYTPGPVDELRQRLQDRISQIRDKPSKMQRRLLKAKSFGPLFGKILGQNIGQGIGQGQMLGMLQGKRIIRNMLEPSTKAPSSIPSPQTRGHIVDRPSPQGSAVETEVYPVETEASVEL